MKLRCQSCQKVIKVDAQTAACPSCGAGLAMTEVQRIPGPPLPTPEGMPTSGSTKGRLATRQPGQEALTCGVVMALIYLVLFGIALASGGHQGTYWVLAIAVIIGGIAFAVWIERSKRRQP